ncbi:MAG TPA: hypothetical protein DHW82_03260 [Spirochaetia bacterium]|nr:MAG: hypothetical protein A2Y41_02035 [Spirochaetes bacterium GWB1_36_13]HCL56011.1 hypothetical protein [Spirochaetia bacterium]
MSNNKHGFFTEMIKRGLKYPKTIIVITFLFTIFFGFTAITQIKIENDLKKDIPQDHPVKIIYDWTIKEFGAGSGVMIAIESKNEIFTLKTLEKLKKITDEIESIDNEIFKSELRNIFKSLSEEEFQTVCKIINEAFYEIEASEDLTNLFNNENLLEENFPQEEGRKKIQNLLTSNTDAVYQLIKHNTDENNEWKMRIRKVNSLINVNTVYAEYTENDSIEVFFAHNKIKSEKGVDLSNYLLEKNIIKPGTIQEWMKSSEFEKVCEVMSFELAEIKIFQNFNTSMIEDLSQILKETPKKIKSTTLINLSQFALNPKKEIFLSKNRLLSWDFFENFFFAKTMPDHTTVILIEMVPFLKGEEIAKLTPYISNILKNNLKDEYTYYISGEQVIIDEMSQSIYKNIKLLVPIVLLVFSLILFLSFRNWIGIVLPLLSVFIATIWVFGTIALFGKTVTSALSIVPVILIAVSSGYSVHIVHRYYYLIKSKVEQKEALHKTVEGIGFAVFLSTLTTMGGFFSMVFNGVVSLRFFGLFTGIGVFYALFLALFLVPSLLHFIKIPKNILSKINLQDEDTKEKHGKISHYLEKLSNVILHKPKVIWIFVISIISLSLVSAPFIVVDLNMIDQFKEKSKIKKADHYLSTHFAGTSNYEIIIDSGKPNGVFDYGLIKKIDTFQNEMNKLEMVGKSVSLIQMIKKSNQTQHFSNPDFYKIPDEIYDFKGNMIVFKDKEEKKKALEAVCYSFISTLSQDDSRSILDSGKQKTKVTFILKSGSSESIEILTKHSGKLLEQFFHEEVKVKNKIEETGFSTILSALNKMVVRDQIQSIILAMLVVFLVMFYMQRSLMMGLIAILPLFMAVLINYGIMSLFGIKLNAVSAIISAIAIGTGIDYTIHFYNDFTKKIMEGNTKAESIHSSIVYLTGERILINVLSVSAGFVVLCLSNLISLIYVGVLTTVLMFATGLASITLIPLLLKKLKHYKKMNLK